MTPDLLLIGHIAHDRTPHGPQLGGTVAYAALTAAALGLRVAVVTSARPGDPVLAGLDGIALHVVPAESSTIFVNTYTPAGRQQRVEGQARVLGYGDIPPAWRAAPTVLLGLIAAELDDTLTPERFPQALVGLAPQGWMRAWDAAGCVTPIPWASAPSYLPAAGLTVLSEEDIGRSDALEREYAALASRLVVTRAERGATLYTRGTRRDAATRQDFPALPIDAARHPTGAGDVFTAALLAALHRQPGAWEAAMPAALRAAIAVAGVFVEQCPDPGVPSPDSLQTIVADPRVLAALPTHAAAPQRQE